MKKSSTSNSIPKKTAKVNDFPTKIVNENIKDFEPPLIEKVEIKISEEDMKEKVCFRCSKLKLHDDTLLRFYGVSKETLHSFRADASCKLYVRSHSAKFPNFACVADS